MMELVTRLSIIRLDLDLLQKLLSGNCKAGTETEL